MEEKENKLLTQEDLKKMSPKEIAEYKIALTELSLDVEDLIKKCDELLSK